MSSSAKTSLKIGKLSLSFEDLEFETATADVSVTAVSIPLPSLADLTRHLTGNAPAVVCSNCGGKGCEKCRSGGVVPKHIAEAFANNDAKDKPATNAAPSLTAAATRQRRRRAGVK